MKIAYFDDLNAAQNILIDGAGVGFDVFCGLPLYFWMKKLGKTVHLANTRRRSRSFGIPYRDQALEKETLLSSEV